jgi:transposase
VARPKQRPIQLSGLERSLLQDYAKDARLTTIRAKAQAVLLASADGGPAATAPMPNRKPSTVARWLRGWRSSRLGSIFTGHQGNGNAAKLTAEQKAEIQQVLQSPPSDFGLPKEFWEVPQLKQYITATFGVTYESEKSYHFLLKFGNLSFKYADTFDRKRDDAFIVERMRVIEAELVPLLTDDAWEVFAVDEVRIQQEAVIRRAWLQKGERTIVKVNRQKEAQSYIGFLDQKGFGCELYELSWQKSSEVLKGFEQFLQRHPDKKICIVWDNAPFHKSKEVRDELTKGGLLERVHLIAMPPYAPDNNPIEHVWNTAKQHVANIQHETFEQSKQAFMDFVTMRPFEYTF